MKAAAALIIERVLNNGSGSRARRPFNKRKGFTFLLLRSFTPPFESLSALFKADATEKKKTVKNRISLSFFFFFKCTEDTKVFVCVYAPKCLVRKIDSMATPLTAGVFVRLVRCSERVSPLNLINSLDGL